MLTRIYDSLNQFSSLTDRLRTSVDERLAAHLQVTGWQDGVLRVALDQPVLATRWRFQEPSVRQRLAREPGLSGLREIRLVMVTPAARTLRHREGTLAAAPADALASLAAGESHPGLREALARLATAAAAARQDRERRER